jgi:hypothetical protein
VRHLEPFEQRPQLVASLLAGGDDDAVGGDRLDGPVIESDLDPVRGDLAIGEAGAGVDTGVLQGVEPDPAGRDPDPAPNRARASHQRHIRPTAQAFAVERNLLYTRVTLHGRRSDLVALEEFGGIGSFVRQKVR